MSEPADRTSLAWTRTSFAFLGNGALLTIRNLRGPVGLKELLPALLAGAVALLTYLIALRRQRVLQEHATPERVTPRRQVYVIGTAVVMLVVATTVGQLI
ncbi:DUF202 domain-containing protein [Mycobacterium terramassiliense]|uniref:DUF202 domain-containing protein n=1 Tax=Mycobacterium terramassiliense TaxID=1841859 RepID=UPI00097D2093|nr:DUF202 domain-containing protein [Mycobacterium terramassiliense]